MALLISLKVTDADALSAIQAVGHQVEFWQAAKGIPESLQQQQIKSWRDLHITFPTETVVNAQANDLRSALRQLMRLVRKTETSLGLVPNTARFIMPKNGVRPL